ncbi:MAG: aspartate kinase, partial [bacterium]
SKALARHKKGDRVVVVASAMKGETDGLIKKALDITDLPDLREYDSMVSTGEQVSTALLAIAINAMGGKARSMLSFQLPLRTDSSYKDARIEKIETGRINELLDEGYIVVVAGFQGVDADNNITTLGRGGSDTSAVALAAALGADVIEICSDVDGIYTTDPGIVENARRLDKVSYEEVIELASLGAKVLQIRAVEMAMKYEIPVLCLSTFSPTGGTLVTKGDEQMEQIVVSGVALDKDECKVTIQHVPDRPGVAAKVFKPLSNANISVDMIIQNVSEAGYTDISFTVRKEDLARARELAKEASRKLEAEGVTTDDNVVKVSVVGLGMRSHAGVASRMFEALSAGNVNIQMISTSEIKVSCVVDKKYGELAVRLLHDEFELHKKSGGKKSSKKTAGKAGSRKKKTAKKASGAKKK